MGKPYSLRYPDGAVEAHFKAFLGRLEPARASRIVSAILDLEADPRPEDPGVNYVETEAEKLLVLLELPPGRPFRKELLPLIHYVRARHHITVEAVTVVCALDDGKRIVWLTGLRPA